MLISHFFSLKHQYLFGMNLRRRMLLSISYPKRVSLKKNYSLQAANLWLNYVITPTYDYINLVISHL